jgi:hypothetical protein
MNQAVVGIFHSPVDAKFVVEALVSDRVLVNDISVLLPDRDGNRSFVHDNSSKAPEGAIIGVGAGGVVGGVLGLLASTGALVVPGVGPLIAAGPIMAALSGAALGATIGGIGGVLIGMGIPEYEAKMFEGKVMDGNILLAVHCADHDHQKHAEVLFRRYKASAIHSIGEAAVKIIE